MEIKIQSAGLGNLEIYKSILNKYNATYKVENEKHFAIIEITDLKQLLSLPTELETDIIIHPNTNGETITIYDGYMD